MNARSTGMLANLMDCVSDRPWLSPDGSAHVVRDTSLMTLMTNTLAFLVICVENTVHLSDIVLFNAQILFIRAYQIDPSAYLLCSHFSIIFANCRTMYDKRRLLVNQTGNVLIRF